MDQKTATRATIDQDWIEAQKKIDWMHAPNVENYVNKLVSGKGLGEGGYWARYAKEAHVDPLLARLQSKDVEKKGLSMLALACGAAHIEKSLIDTGWPISSIHALEYDEVLRARAEETLGAVKELEVTSEFYDFNSSEIKGKYDLIFCSHAIHHATDLEFMISKIHSAMHDDSLFIGIDYFGPTRFQVEPEVRAYIEELYSILPDELKRDLRQPDLPPGPMRYPSVEEVRLADPSESVRSSDLRTMLFTQFPTVEVKPMGGTILRWLLQYRAGNFKGDNPCHVAIADLLCHIEERLIRDGRIKSDDLFFVLGAPESALS